MKKFIIYKDYDPQQECECMRCFIGDRDDYEDRKNYIAEAGVEMYNDNGEIYKSDQEYDQFLASIESQLKLKCKIK